MAETRAKYPDAQISVWAQDEARVGLIPVVRRVWAVRGSRPRAIGRRRYQWMYLYAFVRPATGEVQWLLLPTVSVAVFSIALEHFARAVGAGPQKRVVLVLDGAGWHTGKDLRVPDGIELLQLPPYSPELQPAERLWPLVNEAFANRCIETLDELEALLVDRCRHLTEQPQRLRGLTHFHWWTNDDQQTGSIRGR